MSASPMKTTALNQVRNVAEMLWNENARQQLSLVASAQLQPDRMMRLLANAVRKTPKLGECHPMSMLGALMQCSALGLEPNTAMGHCYLIPFEKKKKTGGKWVTEYVEAQLVIGYKGFAELARRSGRVASIHADVVYTDCPEFDYLHGSGGFLRHKPGPREGTPLYAYCYVQTYAPRPELPMGEIYGVLPYSEVLKRRDNSQGYIAAKRAAEQYKKGEIDHPWAKHEHAMARKTAIRALASQGELPMQSEDYSMVEAIDGRRADYRSYAATADPIDLLPQPEDGDQDQPEPNLDDDRGKEKAEPKPATRRRAKKTEQKPAAKQPEASKAEKPEHDAKDVKAFDAIEQDLLSGLKPEAARSMWGPDIADMRERSPGLHAELEELFAEYEADPVEGDEVDDGAGG